MSSKKSIAVHYVWHLMWQGAGCQMENCVCPHGRVFFEDNGPWLPSVDRWPIAGRDGGTYNLDNVRLAHQTCNKADGGKVGGSVSNERKTEACRANWAKADLRAAGLNPNSRNLTDSDREKGGNKGRCTRWYINKGKPCTCGHHEV